MVYSWRIRPRKRGLALLALGLFALPHSLSAADSRSDRDNPPLLNDYYDASSGAGNGRKARTGYLPDSPPPSSQSVDPFQSPLPQTSAARTAFSGAINEEPDSSTRERKRDRRLRKRNESRESRAQQDSGWIRLGGESEDVAENDGFRPIPGWDADADRKQELGDAASVARDADVPDGDEKARSLATESRGGESDKYASLESAPGQRDAAPAQPAVASQPPPPPPVANPPRMADLEPWRQREHAPRPTRAEVEDYRVRLERRLLERYNNLPRHAGKVGKVSVVLSKPLDESLDGTLIRAEFDQLVYDPWGKRIPELEQEYYLVTFGAGGARQVHSDPSIRVGLDMEKTYSERVPLNADPFRNAPESRVFHSAPTAAMPDWWRPDFPELAQ